MSLTRGQSAQLLVAWCRLTAGRWLGMPQHVSLAWAAASSA
jgi:hypothetical protein